MTKPVKRGRPVGSKNKPKTYALTRTQVAIAKKLGLKPDEYLKAGVKAKLIKPVKTDWYALSKRLQEALESQIADYNLLDERAFQLEKQVKEHEESHRRYLTIISYLETKLGLNSV